MRRSKYKKPILQTRVNELVAKQRHQEVLRKRYKKESEVVVVEKRMLLKFMLQSIGQLIRVGSTIIIIALATVGLIALLLPETRGVLHTQYVKLVEELRILLGG